MRTSQGAICANLFQREWTEELLIAEIITDTDAQGGKYMIAYFRLENVQRYPLVKNILLMTDYLFNYTICTSVSNSHSRMLSFRGYNRIKKLNFMLIANNPGASTKSQRAQTWRLLKLTVTQF